MTTCRRPSARRRRVAIGLAVVSLAAAGCSSDGTSTEPSSARVPTESAAPDVTDAPAPTDDPTATDAPATADVGAGGDFTARVPTLEAPTGEPMVVGLINSEGVPGLDFPDIRVAIQATFHYLNGHGGFGGRPLVLKTCASKGFSRPRPDGPGECERSRTVGVALRRRRMNRNHARKNNAGHHHAGVGSQLLCCDRSHRAGRRRSTRVDLPRGADQ